jgi:hypothetical protein
MAYSVLEWQRTPNAIVFDTLGTETIGPISLAASQATTTAQTWLPMPTTCKIVKVGIAFGAVGVALASTLAVNITYNTNPNPASTLGAYLANGVVPNDNSFAGAASVGTASNPNTANTTFTQQGGLGVPTNYAVDNQPLFAADITLQTTNFPSATQAGGGIAYFVPTNPDAVYPCGASPVLGANGYIYPNGYFALRAATPGSGTVAGLVVTLFYKPITGKQKWGSPTNTDSYPLPGSTALTGDF